LFEVFYFKVVRVPKLWDIRLTDWYGKPRL